MCNRAHLSVPAAALVVFFSGSVYAGSLSADVARGDGTPVRDAVVSIRAKGQDPMMAAAGTKAIMVQQGQRFRPHILPIQVGTTVEFPNRDPFRHHVYSFAAAKTFELKLFISSEADPITFDKAGVIPLGCNIHDNMLAYIYVVDTPYFDQTDKDGKTVIDALPAGEYTVEAWHPNQRSSGPATANITITADGNTQVQFEMDLKRSRRQRDPGAFDEKAY